jgi:broad specificity phosphatase PhoE
MKHYDTMEDLLNEYNKPETQRRLNELRDQELGVLETPTIRFSAKQEEVIRLTKGKFYYRGEEVEDKYQVYERFNEWLKMAEADLQQ